jgi:hypothetical protein
VTLFRVVFETEVMILASDEQEAIRDAERYVEDENPTFYYSEPIRCVEELREWVGAIPYTSRSVTNPDEMKCEEFVPA